MMTTPNPESQNAGSPPKRHYADYIARALATEGGHLALGRGGATLYFESSTLSGCREEQIKAEAIAAGLPVIDSRQVPFKLVWDLAVGGPTVAVGKLPCQPPYHAFSFAPLSVVAAAYRAAGAEVFNLASLGNATESEG